MPDPTPPHQACPNGWCVHRDGDHQAGPFAREADAFSALLRMQPMSTHWATEHEGWSFDPPTPCDGCIVILGKPDECPGVLAHCQAGMHCTSTDAACAAAASYDHSSTCEICGASLVEAVRL